MKKLIVILLFFLVACREATVNTYPDFKIAFEDVIYKGEYGEQFNDEEFRFDLLRNGLMIDYDKIDTSKVDSFKHQVYVDKKEFMINVEIVDTQKPIIEGERQFTIIEGEQLNLADYIRAYDVIDGELDVSFSDYDHNKVGTYEVIASAKDKHGLETTKKITINVKSKPIVTLPKDTIDNDDILYVDGHIIVNKKYGLPRSYAPGENSEAVSQLRLLISDMRKAGLRVSDSYSGYRSYDYQQTLYNNYVKNYGQAEADRFSAKPGHSEHQTGLTYDLKSPSGQLLTVEPEITWVRNNAHKYGFVVRYPENKEHITGYMYEPWHLRYFGSDATLIFNSSLTIEEYYNISAY